MSNFTGSSGFMLLTKSKKYLFTDFRYIERAKNTIKKGIEVIDVTKVWRNPKELNKWWQKILRRHRITQLGIEEADLTVFRYKQFKKISPKIKFKDCSGKIEKLREIKSKPETSNIQKSQSINEKVFAEIKKVVQKRKPITELDLAWKIKELGHKFGADDVSFAPIIAFGENSAIPHHSPTNRKLKKSDVVLIDMGMKYKGYCSDMSRTILPAKPTEKQKEIYNLVLEAQTHAIKNVKPGMTGRAADNLSRKIINKAGYEENYGHAGGHGIGLDIHETPSISRKYTKTLKPNTIITIEPGIYLPGEFGVRIEDMVLLGKKTKNLTKIKKDHLSLFHIPSKTL